MGEYGAASISYRVPYADTDQMAVVYYANYLVYFERVRNEMLRGIGYTYARMEAEGLQLPVIEAHVDYRASARYDDLLTIVGHCEPLGRTRLKVHCRVERAGELLAAGHTIHVCWSMARQRPVRLPDILQQGAPR